MPSGALAVQPQIPSAMSQHGSAEAPCSASGSSSDAPHVGGPQGDPGGPNPKAGKSKPAAAWDTFMGALGVPRRGGRSGSGSSTPGGSNPMNPGGGGTSRRGSLEGDLGVDVGRLMLADAAPHQPGLGLGFEPARQGPQGGETSAQVPSSSANGSAPGVQGRVPTLPSGFPPVHTAARLPDWQGQALPAQGSPAAGDHGGVAQGPSLVGEHGSSWAPAAALAARLPSAASIAGEQAVQAELPSTLNSDASGDGPPSGGLGHGGGCGGGCGGSGGKVWSGRLVRGPSEPLSGSSEGGGPEGAMSGLGSGLEPATLPLPLLSAAATAAASTERSAPGAVPAAESRPESPNPSTLPGLDPSWLPPETAAGLATVRAPREVLDMVALYSTLRPPRSPFLDSNIQVTNFVTNSARQSHTSDYC